ncbi:DUF732 domain-containing protein [Mycobacterium sp. CVI_P3]|uniref:DUF732 domain-containing protein n=1 Tax=Mycobacterium pinniadriaticum TaxID=2994102 RepID=A0ABT3SLX3_9MYCO|nr:DUF732 domain-containing protein [Mycobacterium pinniadriaticum]MCX2934055.1 DUF732 domain-containing protein [Mycobacterium pinniadriaticum]MCX2940448.1 DUF732 domain-containing protein [Mycobacterium pinniadriaticum]
MDSGERMKRVGLAGAAALAAAAGLAAPTAALPSPSPEPPRIPFSADTKVAHTMSPPAPPAPTLVLTDFDRYFLAKMQSEGWVITDVAAFVNNARTVCVMFRAGADPTYVNNQLVMNAGLSMSDALMFSSGAMLTYPDCP